MKGRSIRPLFVSHPGGGVKEQTAGTYAKKLAEKGSSPLYMTLHTRAKARVSPTPISEQKT